MHPNPTHTREDQTPHYQSILHDLITMGHDLARQIHRQATQQTEAQTAALPPAAQDPQDHTIPFDRIARTIRRTILLAQKLAEPPKTTRVAAKTRILRDVENAIHAHARPDQAEALHLELHERLDSEHLDDDLDARPIDDIVLEIRRDLGLETLPFSRPWPRRTPADIATLHARATGARPPLSPNLIPPETPTLSDHDLVRMLAGQRQGPRPTIPRPPVSPPSQGGAGGGVGPAASVSRRNRLGVTAQPQTAQT